MPCTVLRVVTNFSVHIEDCDYHCLHWNREVRVGMDVIYIAPRLPPIVLELVDSRILIVVK